MFAVVLERDGVRLAVTDFGGEGPPVLLLHGLAGYGGEWAATARGLASNARVVAFDARGHGASTRVPTDVSREAHVSDAAFAFASRGAAVAYLAGRGFPAEVWADGLEERDGAWWPRFDAGVLVRTVREADSRTYWEEWESVRCPILVVRGTTGTVPRDGAVAAVGRARDARLAEIEGAGHDLHLERPDEWQRVLRDFLDSL